MSLRALEGEELRGKRKVRDTVSGRFFYVYLDFRMFRMQECLKNFINGPYLQGFDFLGFLRLS